MLKSKWNAAILVIVTLQVFAQSTMPQSDTVSTINLEANFVIMPAEDMPNMMQVNVKFTQVSIVNGRTIFIDLSQSTDDVVTVLVGSTSIVYDPTLTSSKSNLLPFMPNETYYVTFKRFNGEVYTSQIKLPVTPVFTQPSPGKVFKKTDAVHVAWQHIDPEAEHLVQQSTAFLHSKCYITLDPELQEDFIDVPAGYALPCTGIVDVNLTKMLVSMDSASYGFAYGISLKSLAFSYGAAPKNLVNRPSNHKIIEGLLASRHKSQKWVTINP